MEGKLFKWIVIEGESLLFYLVVYEELIVFPGGSDGKDLLRMQDT